MLAISVAREKLVEAIMARGKDAVDDAKDCGMGQYTLPQLTEHFQIGMTPNDAETKFIRKLEGRIQDNDVVIIA